MHFDEQRRASLIGISDRLLRFGHGFGHASRSIEVINAILANAPGNPHRRADRPLRAGSSTSRSRARWPTAARARHGRRAGGRAIARRGRQHPPRLAFHSDLVTRAASETRSLRELGAGLIVGDIPPLAFAVSASSGIPSIGLGNFTWDWIYADYPRVRLAPSLLPAIRGAYAKASMALRLPMSRGFDTFSNIKDIPFIARHATRTRAEVCKLLKIPTDKPIRPGIVRRLRVAQPRHDGAVEVQEVHGADDAERAPQPRCARKRRPPRRRGRSSASTKKRCTTRACATKTS